jgi:ferredoxin
MPKKYAIHTKPTAHRFKAITPSGIIAWEEGCLKCAVCVKKRCVYKVYDQRNLDSRQMVDSIDNQCMNCLRCVQGCPKELIHKSSSPEFKSLGDRHWTPEIIARLWYQAETGKIPVSGAGYPGPFSGEGFDAMWTDMSEIVRPTRDGIHGREYISTGVDLGKTPRHLVFNEKGDLLSRLPEFIDIPVPVLMRMPTFGSISEQTMKGWAMAAKRLGTFLAAPAHLLKKNLDPYRSHLMPTLPAGPMKSGRGLKGFRLVELPWTEDWDERLKSVRKHVPLALVSVHLPMDKSAKQKALALARAGVSIIHLEGSYWGTAVDDESTAMKDILRSVHRTLIEEGIRCGHRFPHPDCSGMPHVPAMCLRALLPCGDRKGDACVGGFAGLQSLRGLSQSASGSDGRHGHTGCPPPQGRSGPGHVLRRDGQACFWNSGRGQGRV